MEENQNQNNKANSKTESLLKLVSVLLVISCTITVVLLFKINEMNNNLNRLSYIMENETESYQYKDTIDVFYEDEENGEEMLPVYDEYTSKNNEGLTDNNKPETTSKKDNSTTSEKHSTNNNNDTTIKDNSVIRDYVINVNSSKIHYSSCTFVSRMKEENKQKRKGNSYTRGRV